MERLTKRLASGAASYNYPTNCYFDDNSGPDRIAQSAFRQLCVERLAEYEDSKLSPEQAVTAKLIIEAAFSDDTNKAERIRELLKADREGRLVILDKTPTESALAILVNLVGGWLLQLAMIHVLIIVRDLNSIKSKVVIMSDLKPCPFCGGEAVISVDPDAVDDTQGRRWAYNAVCIRCCATSGLTYTPQKAKEAWNRRADNG